jgi:hypothetical protein
MSRLPKPPYAFVIALLATLAAGCGSAASAGDRISNVPVASADEASSLQRRFASIVKRSRPRSYRSAHRRRSARASSSTLEATW